MVFLPVVLGVLSALLVTSAAALAFYYFYCSRKFPVGSKGGGDGTDVEKCPPTSKVSDHPDTPQAKGGSTTTVVTRHGWEEIRTMTSGFSSTVLGEGGFSTVYLARLPSDSSFSLAAVKVHRDSERLHRAFRQELDLLLHVRHENIVRLIGYSDEGEQGALVFEYAPSGTLHEKLHGDGEEGVLPWGRRMSIAYQLASALDYLHSSRDLQVVHNDVKPSNVLLDGDLDCKLCDFGSAKVGFSSTVAPPSSTSSPSPSCTEQRQPMLGSPGYVDPHYLRTGLVSKMSDIYSFGVVALELMTGREAFCPETGRMLAKEMGPALKEEKLRYLVDGRLGGEYDAREAAAVAEVVRRCVGEQPSLRPSMGEVVGIMREKVPSCIQAVGSKSKGAVDVGHEFGV